MLVRERNLLLISSESGISGLVAISAGGVGGVRATFALI